MLTFGRARSLDRLRKSRTTQKPRNPQRKVLNVFGRAVLIAFRRRVPGHGHPHAQAPRRLALEQLYVGHRFSGAGSALQAVPDRRAPTIVRAGESLALQNARWSASLSGDRQATPSPGMNQLVS